MSDGLKAPAKDPATVEPRAGSACRKAFCKRAKRALGDALGLTR